jgi:hypothetical protein
MATINCTKCGAPNELDAGAKFMRCEFCESQIYIDKSGAGFFYVLPFQLDEGAANGVFKRWAAGSDKAADLEATARVVGTTAQYFPVFMFRRDVQGKEEVHVEPAKSTTLPGLHSLKVPPGDLKVFDQKYDFGGVELEQPNIEMMAYLDRLPGEAKEQALVYFPIYNVEYDYQGQRYQATIDGSSGEVFATSWPPRQAVGYYAVGIGGFTVCAIGGALLDTNPVLGGVLIGLMVPAVFMGGLWVAKNM